MPQEAMTVTPDGYEDQVTGEFIYTELTVDGSGNREQMNRDFQATQEENFYPDKDGNAIYHNPVESNDRYTLVEDFGGEQGINEILNWAKDNLSEDEIETFNHATQHGDISDLYNNFYYVKNEMENDSYQGSDAEYSPDAEFIFQNVMPESEYYDFVETARDVLDQRNIQAFNRVMNGGSREQMVGAIEMVKGAIQRSNR